MRKRDSEDLFVTTPDAFIAGWRDPRDDIGKSEEIKFEELLNNVKHGEYRLLTPFAGLNKMVDLYHERCKEVYTVRAKAILEEGSDCKCKQRYLEADVREAVEKDGIFQLLEFDNATKRLTLYGRECGHTFDVSLRAWNKNSECRICQRERFDDKQTSWFGNRKYRKTQEDFDRQIRDLVGDEYRVVSEYNGNDVPVTFLHVPCNRTFECRPFEFGRGRRCSCRKLPGQKEFIKYVSERSSGQYECKWNRAAKRYTIIDTNTGEIVGTWKKDLIVQELERLTPSPILPLKEKGAYELPEKKTIVDSVKQYLQCHYLREEHFSLEDIKIDGLTSVQIRHALDRAAKQNVVKKMGNKQYVYLG